MANLDIIEREGLLDRGRELEDEIGPAFRPLADHPLVGEIRTGIGALAAIAFAAGGAGGGARPARRDSSRRCASAASCCARSATGWPSRRALVITREEVEHVAEVAGEALEAVARDVAVVRGSLAAARSQGTEGGWRALRFGRSNAGGAAHHDRRIDG